MRSPQITAPQRLSRRLRTSQIRIIIGGNRCWLINKQGGTTRTAFLNNIVIGVLDTEVAGRCVAYEGCGGGLCAESHEGVFGDRHS